ncbi:PD-(D/E)XK nuclease family protein [Parashewanella tropica]|uniref:PD-(D/E)XK nuclease family protein n=1 Tax=Parashewanella tropica TaxID=2547970 RepID=UPI001059E515|nr:PD-(D/E)XK nuclease family protein [Parashewanella tropica]
MSNVQTDAKLAKVEEFIYNDLVQDSLTELLNSVKNTNVFEIVGISHYETKHSNTLSWLFNNSNEVLSKYFFESFLKETINITKNNSRHGYAFENENLITKLQKYIYLPEQDRDIEILREKNDIDLLIIDKSNKFVFAIENKINHIESNGQLKKYRKYVDRTYKSYSNYFIFLTKDESWPSNDFKGGEENNKQYLLSSYSAVSNSIAKILNRKEADSNLTSEEKFILEHYLDMLVRKNIVPNEKLSDLCEKIWKNHSEALQILIDHQPSGLQLFKENLFSKIENCNTLKLEKFTDYNGTQSDRRLDTLNWKEFHLNRSHKKYNDKPLIYFGIYNIKSDMKVWVIRSDKSYCPELWKSIGGDKNKTRYYPYSVPKANREKIITNVNEDVIEKETNNILECINKINDKLKAL